MHAWHIIVDSYCADSPGLMYAVLHHGTQHPDQLAPYQQDLLRMYCETILGAKTPVAAEKLDGYSPLLAQLSQDQFKGTVLPAAQKFVKRTPEAALVSMKVLFQALQLDLSSSVTDVVDQLLKLIRGSKESLRYGPMHRDCLSAVTGMFSWHKPMTDITDNSSLLHKASIMHDSKGCNSAGTTWQAPALLLCGPPSCGYIQRAKQKSYKTVSQKQKAKARAHISLQ